MSNTVDDMQRARREQAELSNFDAEDRFATMEQDMVRDHRTGRIIASQLGAEDDSKLNVSFTTESIFDKLATWTIRKDDPAAANVYRDVEMITIIPPGDAGKYSTVHAPVTPYYEWRFPLEYKAFKEGQQAVVHGTPLSHWPAMTPSLIKELDGYGIKTVEQLATLSHSNSGPLRSFNSWKGKAQSFLDQAKDVRAVGHLQAVIDEKDAQHKAELEAIRTQMAEMTKLFQAQQEKASKSTPKA